MSDGCYLLFILLNMKNYLNSSQHLLRLILDYLVLVRMSQTQGKKLS